jgi:peptidoglycan/xylan/chitin deacetylase (PgdA/CDA1 family)
MRLWTIVMTALSILSAATVGNTAHAQDRPPLHVALIFDDGSTPAQTQQFLDVLAQAKAVVTFGSVAHYVQSHPDTAKAMLAAGHEIANHSFNHSHPKDLDDEALAYEVVDAQATITQASGQAPQWYWPPFLEADPRHEGLMAQAGLQVYRPYHLVVTKDYDRQVSADQIEHAAVTDIADGSVILMHEWRNETLEKLPSILAQLKSQGAQFLTFSQMAEYTDKLP